MLKAMRNFVRQRSRHAQQQIWPQVVVDDDLKKLRSHYEVPLQLAEPLLEEPSEVLQRTGSTSFGRSCLYGSGDIRPLVDPSAIPRMRRVKLSTTNSRVSHECRNPTRPNYRSE